ncbi:hypothetical protein FP2506_01190 [Fulvimarina pelagi HTCC2506]|uniref:HTH cro/C1-type domain-containing protein n=1 Tax=Fulvimarina pelagi HTCC2506 TaxID=314231 RepID=Q0G259_9HYPH|nr:helix-turn-helix domain-containing protein [Fulvimarina pelagi]EAU41339.1 hypothetical protein FP2506_01190 [Fulvimarina pelagi HTCC2506]
MSQFAGILRTIFAESARRGWTDAELARRANITPEALSRLSKQGGARFATLERLASAVGFMVKLVPDDDYLERLTSGSLLDGERQEP